MAEKAVKSGEGYTEGAEFRFLGNLFGALMAFAGLLAGTMIREGLDYWTQDIVPLLLLVITVRGLIKNGLDLAKDSIFYEEQKKQVIEALVKQEEMAAAMAAESDQELPRIAAAPKYSEEEVLEAVSKRIEQQREEGLRKNKIIN